MKEILFLDLFRSFHQSLSFLLCPVLSNAQSAFKNFGFRPFSPKIIPIFFVLVAERRVDSNGERD